MDDIRFCQGSKHLHNGILMDFKTSRVNLYASLDQREILPRICGYRRLFPARPRQGHERHRDAFGEAMSLRVKDTLQRLDLPPFLPMTDLWHVDMGDEGIRPVDLPYLAEMDAIFKQIDSDKR